MRNPESGITLIEILIAVSLLSLLSLGMLIAMRIGFNTMEKTDAHLVRNRRVVNSRRILESEIAGFTHTSAEWRPRPQEVQRIPFEQWEPRSMRFVTAYSLQDAWRGRPQIAAFQVIPGDRGIGVRLIVNETPYTGAAQAGQQIVGISQIQTALFAPIIPGPQSFVLADRLEFCRFSYLEALLQAPWRVWRPDWDRPTQLPLGIRIEMAPLDTAPSELHVTTVTSALFVNRTIFQVYSDAL
jgi:hypothetical protein